MASFKSVRKRRQQLNARDMRGLVGVSNGVFWHGVFSSFFVFSRWSFGFSRGGFRVFVSSRGVVSSCRLFAWRFFVFFVFSFFSNGIFSSFRLFAWRLFAARGRQDEMAQTGHHIYVLLFTRFHHVHVSLLFLLYPHMSVMT